MAYEDPSQDSWFNRKAKIRTGTTGHTDNDFEAYRGFQRKSGYDSTIQDPEKRYKNYQKNINKKFKNHLNENYKYDEGFSGAEVKGLAGLAAVGTVASGLEYQRLMKMKQNDHYRNQGIHTKGPGLHTGYGFGLKGSFKASAADDWKSFVHDSRHVANEGIRNSMGLLSKQQKDSFKMSGAVGRLGLAAIPLSAAAIVGSSMLEGQDPGEIIGEQLGQGAGFTGFVMGMRLSGAISGKMGMTGIARGAARVIGGAIGGVTGYAAVAGLNAGIRDMTSAESTVGATFYKASQRDGTASTAQNNFTLTARQKAMQQINSSAMNDRGFTLGNEASILRNISY